jgi:hypothetical protein
MIDLARKAYNELEKREALDEAEKNKLKLIIEICGWIGLVLIVPGWIMFSTNIGKILAWTGIAFALPEFLLTGKNTEGFTLSRVQFVAVVILLPLIIFGYIYLFFIAR